MNQQPLPMYRYRVTLEALGGACLDVELNVDSIEEAEQEAYRMFANTEIVDVWRFRLH